MRDEDLGRPGELSSQAAELHHALLAPVQVKLEDGLDPQEAAVLAVLGNWDLATARDGHAEAAAQLRGAGLLPNPEFDRNRQHPRGGGGEEDLQDSKELSLAFALRPLITRSTELAAERANLKSVDLGIAWQEWQVAQSARLEAVRLGWLRRRLETLREDLAARAGTTALLEQSVTRGDFTRTELEMQRSALQSQRSSAHELERTESSSQSTLVGLIGLDADLQLAVTRPELPGQGVRDAEEHELLDRCIGHRLDLEALRFAYEAQEQRVRQAVLERIPNLSVGYTKSTDETGLRFLGGFVNLDLPAFNRNQGAVAAADASRSHLRHEFEARVRAIHAEIHLLSEALEVLDRQINEVSSDLVRFLALEKDHEAALERGDVSRLDYEAVRAGRLELQLELESLAQARDEALVGRDTSCGGAALGQTGEVKG